ncbi:hypothetical protein NMY22_g9478 [Coprinellus aureogranulatus]|nr:hypothetical protein NMY22_g9478 [Coprinellus aureogranulatus]
MDNAEPQNDLAVSEMLHRLQGLYRALPAENTPDWYDYNRLSIVADQYARLTVLCSTLRLTQRSRELSAHAEHVTRLASVSAFLASVQIGFIAFTAGTAEDRSANIGPVWSALNFFSYSSLFLDTLSAFFSLLFAQSLAQRLDACRSFQEQKKEYDVKVARFGTLFRDTKMEALQFFKDHKLYAMHCFIAQLRNVRTEESLHLPLVQERVVVGTILSSILSFAIGVLIFIVHTQPRNVWVATVVFSFAASILLIYNNSRASFNGIPPLQIVDDRRYLDQCFAPGVPPQSNATA